MAVVEVAELVLLKTTTETEHTPNLRMVSHKLNLRNLKVKHLLLPMARILMQHVRLLCQSYKNLTDNFRWRISELCGLVVSGFGSTTTGRSNPRRFDKTTRNFIVADLSPDLDTHALDDSHDLH